MYGAAAGTDHRHTFVGHIDIVSPACGMEQRAGKIVDAFDRKMDKRLPDFQEPTVEGSKLEMKWTVTYEKAGAPDLVISGVETAVFEGDRIVLLRDDFDPEAQKAMGEWMAEHGAKLQG